MTARVVVNLTWIAPGRVGGSEEYLTRQLAGFDDPGFDPELVCTERFADAHPELVERFPIRRSPLRRDHRGLRIAMEHSWLAAVSRGADVVHHGGGTAPLLGPRPVVLTVHDLQYVRFPEYFRSVRRRYLAAMMPRSVRRAAVIATPTSYVRTRVIERFGVDPDRVVVVPHGVPDIVVDADAVGGVRDRYGLGDRPYVVYPAITHPHKGHAVLVDMLDHLDDVMVVLIGGTGSAEAGLRALIDASPNGRRVVRAGRVPDADRDALLAGASALAFPSEYEGFGAPLVEAMSLGVPVVCSDASAVREVAADAAIVVDTADGEAWADAIGRAALERDVLVDRGHRRRRAFALSVSGAALADAYRLAVDLGGRS